MARLILVFLNCQIKTNNMPSKIALFPGSFDPVTKGHESLVYRGLEVFDEVIIAIGRNTSKNYLFSLEQRMEWLTEVFAKEGRVSIANYQGLTIDFCKKVGANCILRGLRNTIDFEYEKSIAQMHHSMDYHIDTIFMMAEPHLSAINSSIIRDLIRNGGNVKEYIPNSISIK